jgi:hypothetical protein
MNYLGWVQIAFEAGHAPVEDPCPDHPNNASGHMYRIRAYCEGKYDPTRRQPMDVLKDNLAAIRSEFAGQIIDQMMPGASTSPAGIAAYMLERLSPEAISVQVRVGENEAMEISRRN